MIPDDLHFGDDCRPVPSYEPDMAAIIDRETEQRERARPNERTNLLLAGLLVMLDSKAPKTTAAALGVLLELFPTQAEAARAAHVSRAAMTFAVRKLNGQLRRAAKQPKARKPLQKRPNS